MDRQLDKITSFNLIMNKLKQKDKKEKFVKSEQRNIDNMLRKHCHNKYVK